MQCAKPIAIRTGIGPPEPVGCGQCMPCRVNRRREWTGRILLEASGYESMSSFCTMTYDDYSIPMSDMHFVLDKRGLQRWMKKLRRLHPNPIRYFACGEYGTVTQRPHYHMILFGIDPMVADELLKKSWTYGFSTVSELNPQRAAYTASYVVKKWMKKDTQSLKGRPPEFSVSSRRPGIGVAGVPRIVAALQTRKGALTVAQNLVTRTVRLSGKVYPLDRTMTRHLLEGLGLPSNYKFSKKRKRGTPEEDTEDAVKHGKAEVAKAILSDAKLRRRASRASARSSV